MFSRSNHPWKPVGILSSRDKGLKNANHHEAPRTCNQHNSSIHSENQEEGSTEMEEHLKAPIVRIGVLSRSTSTATNCTQSVEMVVPPSRVQSSRVSDSSIETIRQSLREMEAQLVVAQNTVVAETRAEYDLHENRNTITINGRMATKPERQVSSSYTTSKQEEGDGENKENVCPTDQDIKRVLDDLQWAEFVSFRNPKPTHRRSRSQTGKAAMTIKSMGRKCHPERQGRSWWRKHPIATGENATNIVAMNGQQ